MQVESKPRTSLAGVACTPCVHAMDSYWSVATIVVAPWNPKCSPVRHFPVIFISDSPGYTSGPRVLQYRKRREQDFDRHLLVETLGYLLYAICA